MNGQTMNGQTMNGHVTRFPIAVGFATMLTVATVFGAAAQGASDTTNAATTAAAAEHPAAAAVQVAGVQVVGVQGGRAEVMLRPNSSARVEIGAPSRFNQTSDYGE